jgi:hypothetical protein
MRCPRAADKAIFTVRRLKFDVSVESESDAAVHWEEVNLCDNGRSFLYAFAKVMHNTKGVNKVTIGSHSRGRFNVMVLQGIDR